MREHEYIEKLAAMLGVASPESEEERLLSEVYHCRVFRNAVEVIQKHFDQANEIKAAQLKVLDELSNGIADKIAEEGGVQLDTEYTHISGSEMANVVKGHMIPSRIFYEVIKSIKNRIGE